MAMAVSMARVSDCTSATSSIQSLHSIAAQNAYHHCRKMSSFAMPRLKTRPFLRTHRSLHSAKMASSFVVASAPVADLTEFAHQESERFREGLMKLLAAEVPLDSRGKIADICVKIFHSFVINYKGQLPAEPFGKMRKAVESEGLPGKTAACAALGWARCNLYHDYKKYTGIDS